MDKRYRIDVHHHPMPTHQISLGRRGARPDLKEWQPEASLADMDKNGVATSILSLPHAASAEPQDRQDNAAQARSWNEYLTRQANEHKGRFGVFATLPILNIDDSLKEAEYALDVLKADGIGLMTNCGNRWLGQPYYFPLFEELNRRKAVVYTHPIAPNCTENLLEPLVGDSIVEYAADTSRAIGCLLFSGAADRFKDIKWIFSHAGGTMPFLLERFTLAPVLGRKDLAKAVPEGVINYLKRFYYDTAQASHPFAMASIKQIVAVSQLLYGTDYPYRNNEEHLIGLRKCGFTEADLRAIESENARRLLPRWKQPAAELETLPMAAC